MLQRNISGQYLYFAFRTSGGALLVSGGTVAAHKSIDGGAPGGLSGTVIHVQSGQWQASTWPLDVDGRQIGFFFMHTSALPVSIYALTTDNVSGRIYVASGNTVNVFSGQLSGQRLDLTSGISFIASGNTVRVFSGQLSGHAVDLLSGYSYTASGINATVPPITIASGTTYLASGTPLFYSGYYFLASGQNINVFSGQLSGQTTVPSSGQGYLASGSVFKNTFASGVIAIDFPYAYLKVDQSGVTGEATRSPINASRKLTNKWDMVTNSGYLTVFKEDDSTEAYKQAVTTLSGALPVTSLDTQ